MKNLDQISLRQLRCFVTVAEELHFRRAAERLNMRQPPLTQRIQAMEKDLGVELFRRHGRLVELTEAGRLVLPEARGALAQIDRVRDAARRAERAEAGTLRIAVVISASFVPAFNEATRAFRQDCPGVALELTWTVSTGCIQALRQRRVDLALVRRVSQHLDGLSYLTVAHDRLMLVLPANHPKADADRIALSDLVEERFVLFPPEKRSAIYGHIIEVWARAGLTPRIGQVADNGLTILALVAAGFGIAILPSTLASLHMPNVAWKPIDMDERWTSSSLIMLYRKESLGDNLPSRFLHYVEHCFAASHNEAPAAPRLDLAPVE